MIIDEESDTTCLYEITASHIKERMKNADFTYVDIWVPWCTSSSCKPISYYERVRANLKDHGGQTFLVADQYDLKTIKKERERFGYHGKIFVIKHDIYGHQNRGKEVRAFVKELTGIMSPADSFVYSNYFLFKGDILLKGSNKDDVISFFEH